MRTTSHDLIDLLIIDDFGAERRTSYSLEIIYNVIDRRMRKGLPMIINTNISMSEFSRQDLDEDTKRIFSRILGNSQSIRFDGEDLRIKLGKEQREKDTELLLQGK